tara:strand:+ start:1050 stop:1169 length:120 start_codon:yes stop_codon:yes gene_type:complete
MCVVSVDANTADVESVPAIIELHVDNVVGSVRTEKDDDK